MERDIILNEAAANLQSRLTVKQAARLMNVSERMVYMAKKLLTSGRTDLIAAVERGDLNLHRALAIAFPKPDVQSTDRLQRAWEAATDEERAAFLERIAQDRRVA